MSATKNIVHKSLKSRLVDLIRMKGPISVPEYMKIVLTNPESGFYMKDDVFGVKGHFTTNPEVSQMFGELMGAWILQEWRRFGSPKPLNLVEFGPGRGTLMSDITRTLMKLEQTPNSIQIRMIEMSPRLQQIQSDTLGQLSKDLVKQTSWSTHIDGTTKDKDGFTAYIAHEFLDALPIYKFVRDPNTKKWRELLIDYNEKGQLRFGISSQPSLSTRLLIPEDFDGDHIEVCPDAAIQLEKVANHLNDTGKGCMIICDYGFEDEPDVMRTELSDKVPSLKPLKSDRDTFRAFKNHQSWPPLKDPGEADLTADVDFGYLKRHLKDKSLIFGPVTQRSFLLKCGLQQRLQSLIANASEEEKKELISGADLMIEDMGERYKFLALFPKGSEHLFNNDPPAGFS